jgi:hypothetical protein
MSTFAVSNSFSISIPLLHKLGMHQIEISSLLIRRASGKSPTISRLQFTTSLSLS